MALDRVMRIRGTILGETKPRDILLAKGKVTRISRVSKSRPDYGSATALIAPTLFDIQVNGGWGIDLQSRDLRTEDIATLSNKLAAQGVARWVPTIITAAQKTLERQCAVLAEALSDRSLRARIPGIHIEGPYISPIDGPRGAHVKRHVRKPSLRELDRLVRAADDRILYLTLAPEIPGAVPFIRGCVKRGIRVSLGHHNATADHIERATDAGAILSTHLGNGLASTIDRHANPLWPQLAEDRLSAALLADMHHLSPAIMKTFVRAKTPGRIVLTSDATHVAGLKPGHYNFAGTPVELKPNRRICLSGTNLLAGSANMLIEGIFNAATHTDLSLEQAFASASTIPARLFGLRYTPIQLRVGRPATFLLVDPEHEPIRPLITAINGMVYTPSGKLS